MSKTSLLKKLVNEQKILLAPGTHDALSARIIEKAGFQAVYMTGYGQSASVLGKPDIGLLSMAEMADRARKIVSAVDIPVIADGDTGFGNAVNVMRTVEDYEQAGVAAIQLEDQVFPKKCGHMTGREVVPLEEMLGKIEAAIKARSDDDFQIIARTDARTTHGLDEALRRARAFEEAGADIIFLESPESIDEMKQINSELTKPTLANMVEGGRTPIVPADQLQEMGFQLVIYPTASIYAASKAVTDLMKHLWEKGSTKGFEQMIAFAEFNELVGLSHFRELERKYVRR